MAIFNFEKAAALRLLKAAVERKEELDFVKDHGVYLMVAGKEVADHVVEYARGFNPETNPDWYEEARDKCGGDDFVEHFDAPGFFHQLLKSPDSWDRLRVHLNKTTMKLSVV